MKIRFLLIGTSLSLIPSLTSAQCVATQDCATLGYTETSCSGGSGVKCPFGNKWACFKSDSEIKDQLCTELGFTQTCTGTNQTSGVGKVCNGKYSECTCANGYNWNDSSQQCEYTCVIGALYYSDGTCSQDKICYKTLLGVVIYEKSASESGWIMTVKPIKTNIVWDTGSTDSTGITDKAVSASCTNTQKLVALGSRFAAATAANNYKPTGTPSGKSWCLPSYDLLNNLSNSVNFAKVNAGITTAGGTTLGKVYYNESYSSYYFEKIWSSSEYDDRFAWYFYAQMSGSSSMNSFYKGLYGYDYTVRPVLAF